MAPQSNRFLLDNIIGMKQLPDNFIDLAILDPQTGQDEGKRHATRNKGIVQKNGNILPVKSNHSVKEWDSKPPTKEYWDEVFRVSRYQIIMCEPRLSFTQKDSSAGRIVWNLLRKNDFGACQIMWTNLFQKVDYFEYMWNGMIQGVNINVRKQIGNKKLNEPRKHPSQKPVIVYHYLLKKYAQKGWRIMDTHMGSGNSAKAAYIEGFDYWGYETELEYFDSIESDMHELINEKTLFTPQL